MPGHRTACASIQPGRDNRELPTASPYPRGQFSHPTPADIIVGDAGAGSWPAGVPDGATVRDDRVANDDGATGGTLTEREQEVLQALSEGVNNRAIAERFGISRSTVKFHLHAVFEKLGVHGRAEAVTAGVRRGHVLL